MANSLEPGDVRVGHLFDGINSDFPDQTATLIFEETRGATLIVPYIWESEGGSNPQYLKTQKWFELQGGTLPKTLVFEDDKGAITFTGAYPSGQEFGQFPCGRVGARALIFGRPRTYQEEYYLKEFQSTIDGLEEFARFSPVLHKDEMTDEGLRQTSLVINAKEFVEWEHGNFTYSIRSNVTWHATQGRSFVIDNSEPCISTISDAGATIDEHLRAQRAVRALLILVHGKNIAWRSHKIKDDEFPLWMMDGSNLGASPVVVQIEGLFTQNQLPLPNSKSFVLPALRLADVGSEGMQKWIQLFENESFLHAVQPAVEVINGATKFLEPQLMMLAISLDRFGYFLYGDSGRRKMYTNILKCLDEVDVEWPEIGSRIGIAKAISKINNDLKHPDREEYPDIEALAAITKISEIIVRLQIFDLLEVDSNLKIEFMRHNAVRQVIHLFTSQGIQISDSGDLVRVRTIQ